MFTLLTDADVYAPQPLGVQHVLLAAGRVAWIGTDRPQLDASLGVVEVALDGRKLVPGLVDGHVHVTGGGGEGGPATSVPPPPLSTFTAAGVTTAVGLLGTDDVLRRPSDVLARVHGLRAEGLHAWMLTGGYHLPAATVTGAVDTDLALLDAVLGVGEVAVGDHRGSLPTGRDLVALGTQVRSAALLAGKRGTIHLHLGDAEDALHPLIEAAESALPVNLWHPTHVNRRSELLDEAIALARETGLRLDVTAFPVDDEDQAVDAASALLRVREAGLAIDAVTCSSDAGGSLPVFADDGALVRLDVATPVGLLQTIGALVAAGVPLDEALVPFTSAPAAQLGLRDVGRVEVGAHADLLVLDDDLRASDVLVAGRFHLRDGQQVVRGTFEPGSPR